ncbi:hypothetical protein [Siphonobacter aquaeclarae]|nr:hypothetical protein [Siphonobacter aquaeclarae]MBO9641174.1 hypothetical protein [Siphonobacter aquaeclarae]
MKTHVWMKYVLLIACMAFLSSCWAPRCPMKSCHVTMEHRHEGRIYRGRSIFSSPTHSFAWKMKNRRGEAEEKSLYRENNDPKSKKKFKKLLPWEKV